MRGHPLFITELARAEQPQQGHEHFTNHEAAEVIAKSRESYQEAHGQYPLIRVGEMELNRNPETTSPRSSSRRSIPRTWCRASAFRPTRCSRGGFSPTRPRTQGKDVAEASISTSHAAG